MKTSVQPVDPRLSQAALHHLERARAHLIIHQPFFGVLALRLKLVEDPNRKTLAVDGRHIFYNPNYVDLLNDEDPTLIRSAFAHEIMHCVLGHHKRMKNRNPKKWNIAADYATNEMLAKAGFTLHKSWCHNRAFYDKSAEQIYDLLVDGDGDKDGGSDPSGEEPLDELMSPSDDDQYGDENPGHAKDDVLDWETAAVGAANIAKMRGKLPGALQRYVDEITSNKVTWQQQLAEFSTDVGRNDYSWSRPNRKMLVHGLYLPSLYSEEMGDMVVVVDTSASIHNKILQLFGGEIDAMRRAVNPRKTYVIYCDARVQHVDTFEQYDDFKLNSRGGGGTDFVPPFDYVTQHGIDPACLIYLTDLEGRFPSEPDYPVLWATIEDHPVPFGRKILIEE